MVKCASLKIMFVMRLKIVSTKKMNRIAQVSNINSDSDINEQISKRKKR